MAALRFMSFNLRRDVEHDGDNRWTARREQVAAIVRDHAPHVLGTQEGLAHQLADLDARLPGYARVGRDRRGDSTDEACAIYYDAQRTRLVAFGDLWLSDTPDVPASATWGNRLPRMVTWATFESTATGTRITVANTHLDHESPQARRRAAEFLAQRFPGAIVMGDLNAEPGEDTHTLLLAAGWHDADAREPTFHGFSGDARVRLDHILAPRTHRIRATRVLHDAANASDHHPIVAEIELGAAP